MTKKKLSEDDDDSKRTLAEITHYGGKSIVSLLVDIQKFGVPQKKALSFLEQLECLRPTGTYLYRESINILRCYRRDFIALSYTWEASEHEDPSHGLYWIQRRDGSCFDRSRVRNCVFDRIINYMQAVDVGLLWIDRHSIIQRAKCQAPACDHHKCKQKRKAVQVMDLVYNLSSYPVALLGRQIKSSQELNLLARLLLGKLTLGHKDNIRLSRSISQVQAQLVLELLSEITNDYWWTRAWTFQENYRAGRRMVLLIKHPERMERHKRSYRRRHHKALFGKVNGELCIQSVKFSEEATRFCLALRQGYLWRHVPGQASKQGLIEHILHATGKHNLLLAPSDTVTPAIVAAIESRNTGNSWDRLDITANCCQYSTRLVTEHLKGENSSLSLSLLAMCLLNGEILHNGGREESKLSSGMTVSMFLKAQLFSGFKGPAAQESLTFNNGCRFFNVSLDQNGICTRGHLWKLGKTIDTSKYPPQGDWVNDPHGLLSLCQRKQLVYFAQRLRSSGHLALSRTILRYLDHDAWIMATIPNPRRWLEGRLVERYMHIMASELADAIAEGRTLRLGCLWDPHNTDESSYMALFIWDWDAQYGESGPEGLRSGSGDTEQGSNWNEDRDVEDRGTDAFVFTASRPEDAQSQEYDANDLDRHVSLEVQLEGFYHGICHNGSYGQIPKLRIKRWLPGMCFFKGCPRLPVIFPWPSNLKVIGLCLNKG